MSITPIRLIKQAEILESLAERFAGKYAWIEKAEMHAADVKIVVNAGARTLRLAAKELEDRLQRRETPEMSIAEIAEWRSAMMCDHANEVPIGCPCATNCYCKSHTCASRA